MPTTRASRERNQPDEQPRPTESSLHVGPADDHYERAADMAADRALERLAAAGALGTPGRTGGTVRRQPAEVGHAGGAPQSETSQRIATARGGGDRLPRDLRRSMEVAFGGTDFGQVRLHSGPEASDLSGRLGASAFSVGRDIFLGAGTPPLDTREGQRILAHELAHTTQSGHSAQRSATVRRRGDRAEFAKWTKAERPAQPQSGGQNGNGKAYDADRHGEVNAWGEGLKEGMSAPGDTGYYNPWYDNLAKAQAPASERADAESDKKIADTPADNLTYAGVGTSTFALALDMSKTLEVFMKDNKDPDERIRAVFGLVGSMSAFAESTAYAVQAGENAAAGSSKEVTDAAAGHLTAITSHLAAIKAGYQAVVDIVKLIDQAGELSESEKTTASIAIIRQALESAKGTIDTINQLWSMTGTVTSAMLQAAPALSIAINVLDVISNGVNLGYSTLAWGEMRSDKRAAKKRLEIAGTIASKKAKTRWGHPSLKKEAMEIVNEVEDYLKNDTAVPRRQGRVIQNPGPAAVARFEDAKDYLLLKNLQRVAAKRIRRAALNIGATLPAIAGDIAVLSGVGAGVGVGLKAAGGGVKLIAAVTRLAKQKFHDKRGDSKSTENKLKMYDGMVTRMIHNVIAANEIPIRTTVNGWTDPDEVAVKEAAQKRAVQAITASGMTPGIMKKYRPAPGDPERAEKGQELYKAWVEALRKR